MKPIFETERNFLQDALNIVIPNYCWRATNNKIYLNASDLENGIKPIIEFKAVDGNTLVLKKYDSNRIIDENFVITEVNGVSQYAPVTTWEEEYHIHKKTIIQKEKDSLREGKAFFKRYPKAEIRVGVSGGKDSELAYHFTEKLLSKVKRAHFTDFFNTSNETADTYKFVQRSGHYHNLTIHNPNIGFHKWVREVKNDFLPSHQVRSCCQMFKEDRLLENLDNNKEYIIVVGVRKHESAARSYYDYDLNQSVIDKHGAKKLNVPLNFHRLAIIVDWKDHEVWLYTMFNNLPVNRMYELGFNRVGCTVCFNQTDYIDVLVKKYYPVVWRMWEETIRRNYVTHRVSRLNWTSDEWLHRWKKGTSKEYELIRLKQTPERIEQVAKIKGISTALAAKFFNRTCSCCKKKDGKEKVLNSTEISMNLKLFGRHENISIEAELNRKFLCKSCMCKELGWTKDDYKENVSRFMDGGCDLFVNSSLELDEDSISTTPILAKPKKALNIQTNRLLFVQQTSYFTQISLPFVN